MQARGLRLVTVAASVAVLLPLLAACTLMPVTRGPAPSNYSGMESVETGSFPNWPLPPDRVEDLLLNYERKLEQQSAAGSGTTGAQQVVVSFPATGETLKFKWKLMEGTWKPFYGRLNGVNNSPRKEIAAWKIQEIVLDAEDYVVPLSLALAIPLKMHDGELEKPTLADTRSILGVASVWMNDVTLPDSLLDAERFNRDYTYAYYLANLNLLTYLIKHHDGRPGNFLISKDDARRQVFAIDNGVAFGGIFYNWFVPNWNSIRVPALRKESIDRLRALEEQDLVELLGVVAQLELDEEGIYRNVAPGENLDDGDGVRIEGRILQLGLTEDEIEDVWERIEDLIEDVDEGDIAVF